LLIAISGDTESQQKCYKGKIELSQRQPSDQPDAM